VLDMQTALNLKTRGWYMLSLAAAVSCLFSIVDGALPQLQMHLFAGEILINVFAKGALWSCLALGAFLRPRIDLAGFPLSIWKLFVAYLVCEIGYLFWDLNLPLSTILHSFIGYYSMYLIAPAVLLFRSNVPGRVAIRWTVSLFLPCAAIGIAQNLTGRPLLYTASADMRFQIMSWDFFGEVRAFSLFSSGLFFGLFCSLCGALGIALSRTRPLRGAGLVVLSGVACYTTLTRNSYLIFFFACIYSALVTFGHKPRRGLWAPTLFFVLGLAVLFAGLKSYDDANATTIQSSYSLIERASSWTYYAQQFARASTLHQAFGLGLYPDDHDSEVLPLPVDNIPLAVTLHIGIVGLILFSALLIKMWLYLRQRALEGRSPIVVAAASFWATLATAGIFNSVFPLFGAVFCLAVICERAKHGKPKHLPDIDTHNPFASEPIDLASRSSDEALVTHDNVI
jgi:hypothetical protein